MLIGLLVIPVHASAPHVVIPSDWLGRLNFYRAMAGLGPVNENSTWSAGDALHAQYMVENNLITHYETNSTPFFTPQGDMEARNSNLVVFWNTTSTDADAIDEWMTGPFHALGIIDPTLQTAGYGVFRHPGKPQFQTGAALDVQQGRGSAIPTSVRVPVLFPGNGTTSPFTSFTGGEMPDPLQFCPNYSAPTGAPIMLQLGYGVATNVTAYSVADGSTQLATCEFDGRSSPNLSHSGAIVLMPRQELVAGHRYTVSVTVNGATYTWSFNVGEAQVVPVSPPRPWSGGSAAVGAVVGTTDAYFAEGFTGLGFQEYLTVANLTAADQSLTVDYLLKTGPPIIRTYPLRASSRLTIDVNQDVGPDQEVAAHLHSTALFVAERPMYFNLHGVSGGHDVVGAAAPGKAFYFAEGFTGTGFDEWLTLMNPNPASTALTTVTYYFKDGTPPKFVPHSVPPNSRLTIHVNLPDEAGPGRDVSAVVSSDQPIVAERPMYFTYMGKWTGGHDVVGAAAPGLSFLFAEGYAGPSFDEYYTVLNPDLSRTATVDVSLHDSAGNVVVRTLSIPAGSRETLFVNPWLPPGTTNSAVVTSTNNVPIVAERPEYFSYGQGGWDGGHDAMGTGAAAPAWYFAEGMVNSSFEEWYTILNPGPMPTLATLKFFSAGGLAGQVDVKVGAGSRATVKVNDYLPAGTPNSAIVTAPVPILVERPMYFNY